MKKIRIIALLSAFLMFAALFLLFTKITNNETEEEQSLSERAQKIVVVKARTNIAPYTLITEDMVEMKEIVAEKTFDDYYSKKEDVIGSVAVSDVFKGETLSKKRIVMQEDANLGLAYRIESGKRAVTIPVSITSGVANMLKVGNYVDVVVTMNGLQNMSESEDEKENSATLPAAAALDSILNPNSPANSHVLHEKVGTGFSYIAFQKMKILSLDDRFYISANAAITGNSYGSVTLETTPAQATQLILIRNTASIDMILRNQTDEEIVNEPRGEVLQPYEANPEQ